jgi:hypothetical protein
MALGLVVLHRDAAPGLVTTAYRFTGNRGEPAGEEPMRLGQHLLPADNGWEKLEEAGIKFPASNVT